MERREDVRNSSEKECRELVGAGVETEESKRASYNEVVLWDTEGRNFKQIKGIDEETRLISVQ